MDIAVSGEPGGRFNLSSGLAGHCRHLLHCKWHRRQPQLRGLPVQLIKSNTRRGAKGAVPSHHNNGDCLLDQQFDVGVEGNNFDLTELVTALVKILLVYRWHKWPGYDYRRVGPVKTINDYH